MNLSQKTGFSFTFSFVLWILFYFSCSCSQNFEKYTKEMGSTLCRYLAQHHQLPRHYHRTCGEPVCSWDDWLDAAQHLKNISQQTKLDSLNTTSNSKKLLPNRKKRVVVSYGHNGFGNQIWQHTFAFMVAESLGAKLLIGAIPDYLSPDGVSPPNTWAGIQTMDRLLPSSFLYDTYPKSSYERQLCDSESFFIADRPRDWRNGTYTGLFKQSLYDILDDPKPRCLKFVGYFQNYPLCRDDVVRMWTTRMFQNFTVKPGPNDLSIYLRCLPRHYHFNDKLFYEVILNRTSYENIWLFQAPECPTKLNPNPNRDGLVSGVIRLLTTKYHAKRWPIPPNMTDDSELLLHDLAGLSQSKKLILPVSSWAFWAGYLSNASEIHINAPPHHQVMYGLSQYYYHHEKTREYFGRLVNVNDSFDIVYQVELSSSGRIIRDLATSAVAIPIKAEVPIVGTNISTAQEQIFQTDIFNSGSQVSIAVKKIPSGGYDIDIRQIKDDSSNKTLIQTSTSGSSAKPQLGNFRISLP
jgi:hypothetical protein